MANFHFNGYYLTAGLLGLCTVVGIIVAARFRREADEDLAPTTTKELLDPLEKAYYSGLMHPEEIARIRESVQKSHLAGATSTRPLIKPKPARPVSQTDGDPLFDDSFDGEPPDQSETK